MPGLDAEDFGLTSTGVILMIIELIHVLSQVTTWIYSNSTPLNISLGLLILTLSYS